MKPYNFNSKLKEIVKFLGLLGKRMYNGSEVFLKWRAANI